MRSFILFFITLIICSISVFSQSKQTPNTMKLDAGKTSERATIQDMQPLVGIWQGEGLGGTVEEIYSQPQDGVMMGMFRFFDRGRTVFYELITVVEEKGTLVVRLKHFSSDLKGWEEKDRTVNFPFVKKEGNRMYFEGQTFEFIGKNKLKIYVAMKQQNGDITEELFSYTCASQKLD